MCLASVIPFVPDQLSMAMILRGTIVNPTVWLKVDIKVVTDVVGMCM